MPPTLSKIGRAVEWTTKAVLAGLLLTCVALNGANVVGRYVFLAPIEWAEHAIIFIMIWCVYVGAALVVYEGSHLVMNFFSALAPASLRRVLDVVGTVLLVAMSGFVAAQSWQVVQFMARMGQRSVVGEIPMVIPHSALLVGFCAMAVAAVLRWWTQDGRTEDRVLGDFDPDEYD